MEGRSEQSAAPDAASTFQSLGKRLDEIPQVQAAEQALQRAKAELGRAQEYYRQVRRQAADELKSLKEKNLGDVVEGTLGCVRRYPGFGLLTAVAAGFLLGRWLRRL
ncbi:MAG: hypothetical protein ACYC35_01500 [Pirellulales bacterium]